MGQLERRLRRLEEQDERVDFDAALRMASDEDIFLVSGYTERLEEHRRRALQQG
jgi:hypothetical protein